MSLQRFHVGPRYCEYVIHNGTIYLSGQVPDDASQDIGGQTRQVLDYIERWLTEAGSHRGNIVSATIYLADLADYDGMNAVWDAWLPQGCAPARATVQARLARPEWKVEIQIVAAVSVNRA
ncbi:MAG: RidA family protein [Chitinivorax sp.]